MILIHNVDTSDCLTNGQLGTLVDVIRTTEGELDKLIIEFKNENAGRMSRAKNPQITSKYPKGTVIDKVSLSYSLSKKTTTASSATLVQFPIKVAHAITAHKIQGQTIPTPLKIAVDISSCWEDAQAYVMVSRVENLEQLYILGRLPEKNIRASQNALSELLDMNKRSINENPISWDQNVTNNMKIASLNCMNLKNTYEDIIADHTLLKSDILLLQETWLTEEDIENYNIHGFEKNLNIAGPGKGIAVYYRKEMFQHVSNISQEKIQLTKFRTEAFDIISFYRSSDGNSVEMLNCLKTLITPDRQTVICGDLNMCYIVNRKNRITKHLETSNFKQIVKEPTHVKGRQIDHFYHNFNTEPTIYQYSPYYSDHDAICVTIPPNNCDLMDAEETNPATSNQTHDNSRSQ